MRKTALIGAAVENLDGTELKLTIYELVGDRSRKTGPGLLVLLELKR